jgi:hypothetical protein
MQQDFDFGPELTERIGACAVVALGPLDLAWKLIRITILPDRLFTHLHPP